MSREDNRPARPTPRPAAGERGGRPRASEARGSARRPASAQPRNVARAPQSFGVYGRPDQARRRQGIPPIAKIAAGALALVLVGFGVSALLPKGDGAASTALPNTSSQVASALIADGSLRTGAEYPKGVTVGWDDAPAAANLVGAADPFANLTRTITVTFAGDCTLGTDPKFGTAGSFPEEYDRQQDPSYFLRNVAPVFSADDLTVVNMEGTLTEETNPAIKTFTFKGPAEYTQILTSASVEAASMANNHSQDFGEKSYTDTIAALEAAGVPTFGYDRVAKLTVNGVKVALLGFSSVYDGMAIQDEMESAVKQARQDGAELVMVYFHWGIEKDTVPNTGQMKLARSAIDAGADLVMGSHPHVIQGWETYKGRYIVYSLGNFCFGGNHNPPDYDCLMFQQTFTVQGGRAQVGDDVKFIPCKVSSTMERNNFQPTIQEGDEAERILTKVQKSTDAIANLADTL
ncbi:MAG: CapA family protein [Eggerthellaceae bacterium]|nr:CapA family protein [Eggerthellaceae bacterium]